MALNPTSFLASFDITDKTQELDISPLLLAALMVDTGVLGAVPIGESVYDTTHWWTQIKLNTGQVTVDGTGYNSVATTIGLAGAGSNELRVGSLLKNVQGGITEVAQVTAIASATSFTVARGYGGTTAANGTFAANAVVDIINMPLQEASDIQTDVTQVPSPLSNYTQIFERSILISRNQQKRKMASIPDFLAQSLHDRTMEIKRELEKTVIHGIAASSSPAGSDTVYRTMNGLLAQITNTVGTAEAMSSTVFNNMVQNLVDNGAADDMSHLCLVAPTKIRRTISTFQETNRRLVESDVRAGHYIEQLVGDLGVQVDVVTSNYLGSGSVAPWQVILLDTSRAKLLPFADDTFKLMAATDWVDGIKRRVLGEYTLEVRNGDKAHFVHTGLTG